MKLITLFKNSMHLWRSTLYSVIVLSLISTAVRFSPHFLKINIDFKQNHALIGIFLLINIIDLLPKGAIMAKLYYALHGKTITFSQAIGISLLKLPRMIFSVVLIMILFFFSSLLLMLLKYGFSFFSISLGYQLQLFFTLLFVILSIYIIIYYILTIFILLNEEQTVLSAIKKSILLIQGEFLDTFLAILIVFSGLGIIAYFFQQTLGIAGVILVNILFTSFSIAVITVLYDYHCARKNL